MKKTQWEAISRAERLGYLVTKPLISVAWALYWDSVTFHLL